MGQEAAQQERGRSWDGVVRREVAVTLRVLSEEDRSVEVVASTEALDSHGDIVKQFWDLSRYSKNGPVLWNHNLETYWGTGRPEDSMPIGRGQDVRVDTGQLVAKLVLVKGSEEEEPFIAKLWRRIQQGVVKAVSVGFRPGQVTRIVNADGSTHHYELGSADRPNELREISFVPMGSNPEAVAKSIAFERSHLARMAGEPPTSAKEEDHMSMTETELKALNEATSEAKSLRDRVTTLEKDLTAEKAVTAKLETDLKSAGERATKAEHELIEVKVAALVGVKITPAEKDEHVALAKEIGIDRLSKILEKRADLKILAPVKNGEKTVGENHDPVPPIVEDEGAAGDDINKKALAAANSAA